MVKGVIPEDMINECTTRRHKLIGTCTISVFIFFKCFCLSYDNGQSEQRKTSQGANGNSKWNKVKLSIGKCQSSSHDCFKFELDWMRAQGKGENFLNQSPIKYQYNIKQTSDENKENYQLGDC